MNKQIFVLMAILCTLLAGCESTSPPPVVQPLSAQEQLLQSKVDQFPRDTLALQNLIDYQLNAFESAPSFQLLNRLYRNLETGMNLVPSERYFPFHYYRLGLNEGFMSHSYDMQRWQAFYDQYAFFTSVDLAPPVYMDYLLNEQSESKQERIFQQSIRDNPAFMNAYIELAYLYFQQDKLELAIYVLESARKQNNENTEITSDWVLYRTSYLQENMCERPIDSSRFAPIVDESRRLTRMEPNSAFYQAQLADAFREAGKYQLASFAAAKAASLDNSFESYKMELQLWNLQIDKILSDSAFDQKNRDAEATYVRIYANLAAGNFTDAALLADAYNRLDDASFYGVVYGAYGYAHGQKPAAQNALFTALHQDYQLDDWHKVMLRFAEGEIDEPTMLSQASNRCERSEALFIAALDHMTSGSTEPLTPYWQEIVDLDIKSFYEFAVARYMLKQAL